MATQRLRKVLIGIFAIWTVAGVASLISLIKPLPAIIPVAQTFAQVRDRETGEEWYTATFAFTNNEWAQTFFDYGVRDDYLKAGQSKVWITNTARGGDQKTLEVGQVDVDIEWDDYPPASFLQVGVKGPIEAIRCGDSKGYSVETTFYMLNLDGTVDEETRRPDAQVPCEYDVLRVLAEDGSQHDFFIGSLRPPPFVSGAVGWYIPPDYQPMSLVKAWGVVGRFAVAITGLVGAPLMLGALIIQNERALAVVQTLFLAPV